ncbi:hypothetical protein I545_6466 [Mycobacterium kansasii 662]|uniref:Uncharacterized protein n=3 Tax=Mycobacterium kansasii TaxID=1768 RepID=A0A1V3WRU2_MYCKA|nr:hypothetical protein MKAN_16725 [Mycobacterium kansasii ATCC 12478]EUA03874.1 hypothetical protein I547_2194 [Mycobacterium kansasii 824]EUA06252.1 hypothetical protein I545_6466 [Mycobacterium kansasii 662]KEP44479.1 hypothetical protein MKSMC1_03480 [Mycobacterium kansasii]OOK69273.1 hypothetical protein BZL30_6876 [Mycobacterium kansasii]
MEFSYARDIVTNPTDVVNHYDVVIVGGRVAGRLLLYRPNGPRVNL